MKRNMLILLVLLLLSYGCAKNEKEVIKIGDVGVTLEEFDRAFKASPLAKSTGTTDTTFPSARVTKAPSIISSIGDRIGSALSNFFCHR